MNTKLVLTAAAAVVALTSFSTGASAKYRMAIFDAQSGKKIFDDGKLDGKACAVGKKAIFNPNTGKFIVVPAAKCNF